jgi:YopX protein.
LSIAGGRKARLEMNREILFRAKHIHAASQNEYLDNIWIEGYLSDENHINSSKLGGEFLVDENAVCRRAGKISGQEIWENDICQWIDTVYGKCTGVVRYGEWEQDGSDGEYPGTKCLGWYLEVKRVQRSQWDDCVLTDAEAEEAYPEYRRTISLVDDEMGDIIDLAVIGNIFDNPELLEVKV